jgi:hypothetical protein
VPKYPYVIVDPIKSRLVIRSRIVADTPEIAAAEAIAACRATVGKGCTKLRIRLEIDSQSHYEREDVPPVVEEEPQTPAPTENPPTETPAPTE